MPTTTTTTTTTGSAGTTTNTVTRTAPDPTAVAAAAAAAAPSPVVVLKDGFPVNDSQFPKNGIPDGEAGITKEWLTSCLLGRKLIAANNSVASMELTQIGVGRGYANYTFKAFVKYARPVCPDTPSAFAIKVANTTFGEIMLADQGPDLWEWFNDFYICEAFFYQEYRASIPCAQCKFYWSEIEYPETPREKVGKYGLIIEYLGDDLKMYDMVEGAPLDKIHDALQTVAKIHMASWDDDYLKPVKDGGTNVYINSGSITGSMFRRFIGQEAMDGFVAFLKEDTTADPRLVPGLVAAFDNMPNWYHVGATKHCVLSSFDLRAENLLWRRTNPGDDAHPEYECVPIDHQGWWYGPPTRDLVMLCLTTMEEGEIKGEFENCLKLYYDALVTNGLDTVMYTWENYMFDVRASCWNSLVFAAALNKMVVNTASTFETMQEGDENYAETATLLENMTKMRAAFDVKARIGIDVVGAYAAVPWFESFSESESVE